MLEFLKLEIWFGKTRRRSQSHRHLDCQRFPVGCKFSAVLCGNKVPLHTLRLFAMGVCAIEQVAGGFPFFFAPGDARKEMVDTWSKERINPLIKCQSVITL
jgi:hypothetical protein